MAIRVYVQSEYLSDVKLVEVDEEDALAEAKAGDLTAADHAADRSLTDRVLLGGLCETCQAALGSG